MNMPSLQLKHNGFYPIKNIDKNIPVDIAKKFCKDFHITKDQFGRNIYHFNKIEVEKVFNLNDEAKAELKEYKRLRNAEQRLNKKNEEFFENCSVSYKDWTVDRNGHYIKETRYFDNVDVLVKGNFASITIGKSVIKKHITKSNVVLSKFKS